LTSVHYFVMFNDNEHILLLNKNWGKSMAREHIENEILQLALEALKKNLQMHVEVETMKQDYKADRLLRIVLQGREMRFYAEVKATLNKAGIALLQIQKGKYPQQMLLVTRYVHGQMAEQLKQDGIEFIDTAGNVYINQPPIFIFIKGNRPPETFAQIPLKRAFQPMGLKVIYAFLCNAGLENKPYREIAATADVALGTVGWQMRELKELGYLLDMGKQGNKIIQRENLFQRWVTAYPEKLRPKLMLGRFRGDEDWWQQKTLDPVHIQWGGEVAAAKLTKYLKPQIITIYTTLQHLNQLLIENRLRKDPMGDVEILERFWQPEEAWPYEDMVHPILVYADLIATGNQRNIETAKVIYEQYIVRLVRED